MDELERLEKINLSQFQQIDKELEQSSSMLNENYLWKQKDLKNQLADQEIEVSMRNMSLSP